jgi:hypothetical protein
LTILSVFIRLIHEPLWRYKFYQEEIAMIAGNVTPKDGLHTLYTPPPRNSAAVFRENTMMFTKNMPVKFHTNGRIIFIFMTGFLRNFLIEARRLLCWK